MCVSISILVWIGRRVEVSRRLFGYAGWREHSHVARRKLSGPRCWSYRRFDCSLSRTRAVFEANDFSETLSKHSERRNQHPKPPDSPRRSERKHSKGDEQEAQPHKRLGYAVGQSGGTYMFQVVAAASPSRGGFGQATSQSLRHEAQVAPA